MRHHRTWASLLLVALAALVLLQRPAGAETPIMEPSELRVGMRGYGLTTLSGARPEKFDVEVLGVLRGAFPKGDLVLVRMSGPVIDETGIVAGMSGSPVYVDGKLVGAVAYGWHFCKIPLAGVTPAADMLRVREFASVQGPARADARAEARRAMQLKSRELVRRLAAARGEAHGNDGVRAALLEMTVPPCLARRGWAPTQRAPSALLQGLLPEGADPQIRPLPIPLAVGGIGPARAHLAPLAEAAGFLPVQALRASGAASLSARPARTAPDFDVPLEPGITVGAALVTGDLDIAGMGTLTWVEGDEALAFGHSMFGVGHTDLPLAVGEVQAVVPSLQRSFKLASAGRIVGRITQDREPGVLAKIGEQAPMFPCKVTVRGAADEEYNYNIAGYWGTAPMLTYMALTASSSRWEGSGERYTLDATARITLKGREEPLVLSNSYASYSVIPPASDLVAMPLEALLLNPFEEVEIAGIEYELRIEPGIDAALIESVWADRTKVKPGAELTLYVRLLHYRGEEAVKKVRLRIPETARPGSRVQVLVCDAVSNRMIEAGMDPGLFAPRSFEGLLKALREFESNKSLIVRASVMDLGVRYADGAMPALPPSAMSILQHTPMGGRTAPLVTDVVQVEQMPWVLEGQQSVFVTVEEPDPFGQ